MHMHRTRKGVLVFGSLVLGVAAGSVFRSAPTPLYGVVDCICPGGWQGSALESPPGQACVTFTGISWVKDSDGWCTKTGCGPVSLPCQFYVTATVTNTTADNCGCTGDQNRLWALQDPPQSPGPSDISGQNSNATLTVYYSIPCGSTGAGAGEFGISVRCGNASGPDSGSASKASLMRSPSCADCPLPPG